MRWFSRAVVWLVTAGCVAPDLVPCGDLSCPQSSVCLDGTRCVTADQLAACTGSAEDAPCLIDSITGRCEAGACTPTSCGNGVLDPGEVCDDGNQISGDGCSGTCTSAEVCGNGIVDVAAGEGCDCGDAQHLSPLCTQPNSDDPSAPCDAQCRPRFCGDGVVDLNEQCDGSVPAGDECADFGYYSGSLSCSDVCQLDPTACVGRCGDGIVQSSHEYCDGAVPAGATCVGFGYDLGVLACGLGCGPDLLACGLLDENAASDVVEGVSALWGGNGMIGVVYSSGDAWAHAGTTWIKAPAAYSVIAGSATELWAAGPDHVAVWNAMTGWTDQPAPWPSGTVTAIWASDSLGVFVSLGDSAPLWQLSSGTWTQVTGAWPAGVALGDTHAELWVLSNPVQVWDGTSWTTPAIADADAVVEDSTGGLWASDGAGVFHLRSGAATWDSVLDVPKGALVAAGVDGPYFASTTNEGFGGNVVSQLVYYATTPLTITWDQGLVASDGLGAIYQAAPDGSLEANLFGTWEYELDVYPLRSTLDSTPGGPEVECDEECTGTPPHRTCSASCLQLAPNGTWEGSANCSIAVVTASGATYCGDRDLGTLTDPDDAGVTGIDSAVLWMVGDDVATGGNQSFAWRSGGAWHTATPQFAVEALAGDSISDLYGIVDDGGGGELWHFDGVMWQQVLAAGGPFFSLAVTPTTVYLTGDNGLVSYTRASGVSSMAAVPVAMSGIVGTGGEELFGLTAVPLPRTSALWRFDGTTWSPVTLPVGVSAGGITAAGRDVLITIAGSAQNTAVGLYRLQRTGPW